MKTTSPSLLLLLTVACSSPPYAARAIEDDVEENAAVVVTDSGLHSVLRVGRPHLERIPTTNQLRVTVPIRNIDDESITIWAQTTFYDGKHNPVGDETSREQKIIAPGATVQHTVVSQKETADEFVLRLGWGK
jgi:uncharacterized protein YcfL